MALWSKIEYAQADARAKGMTDAQFGELLAVVGLANQLDKVVAGVQVELDDKHRG